MHVLGIGSQVELNEMLYEVIGIVGYESFDEWGNRTVEPYVRLTNGDSTFSVPGSAFV